MLAQVVLDSLDGCLVLACNGDVINEYRDNEAHTITQVHPDTVLAGEAFKAQLVEHLVELLMPAATGLLEAVESLAKAPHPLRSLLLAAVGLRTVTMACVKLCKVLYCRNVK